jgi:ACS family hexuronate transporter-like MFS transporter
MPELAGLAWKRMPFVGRSAVRFSRRQSGVAALLFTMLLLNYLDRQVLSIVFSQMKTDLGLSQGQYTTAVNAFLLAYGFMYFGSGLVIDRTGARVGVAIFVALWSLVSALHGFVGGFVSLIVLRFLLGMTEPGGFTGAVKTVAERFTPAQRGLATGIFTSGAGVGALIAPPALVYITLHFGWRSAFIITGSLAALWLPFWWKLLDAAPVAASVERDRPRISPWSLFRNKQALSFAATRFFGDSTGYFLMFWLPQHLLQNKKFSFVMLGMVGWIPYLVKDLGAITGGYWSSRLVAGGKQAVYSRKFVMTIAGLFAIAGACLESQQDAWLVFACLILTSFGMGLWSGNFHNIPADAFAPPVVATVHGLAGSFGAIGGIVFNTMVGYFMTTGQSWAIFLTLALLMPLGVLPLWLFVRQDYQPAGAGEPEDTAITGVPASA